MDKQGGIIEVEPAGLTAAYEITKFNTHPIILEKKDRVGTLACTENYRGYYFDLGGRHWGKYP